MENEEEDITPGLNDEYSEKELECETYRWRTSEIGYSSKCPKHQRSELTNDE